MGGRAFKSLGCPRISPEVYSKVKLQTTAALKTIFANVTVPTEMPEKNDYGDIDFLVAGPIHSPTSTSIDNFDWPGTVDRIKTVFNTIHGRRGWYNFNCMYFAIRAPGHEDDDFWVQVDVQVCFKPELLEWCTFELSYASISKMLGSFVKPLGLTMDPEGIHIRVEDMDETNFPGSMTWVSKDPRDVLRIMGLDRRILDAAFKTKNELYECITGSWLFNPAHFASRLAEEKYSARIDDRAPYWIAFVKEWMPRKFPGYQFMTEGSEPTRDPEQLEQALTAWNKRTRGLVREKVFTMFPDVAAKYYTKRATYTKEVEEQRLRTLIMNAFPQGHDGWDPKLPQPQVIIKQDSDLNPGTITPPMTPYDIAQGETNVKLTTAGPLTPPTMPYDPTFSTIPDLTLSSLTSLPPSTIPLYIEPLSRSPPIPYPPTPPPGNMSAEKKLLCLARWTLFDATTGAPYLLSTQRDKNFDMCWTDAAYAGATDEVLVHWAKEMWWCVWSRQSRVNYVGMWKRRFEKEDRKSEAARKKEVEEMERLEVLGKEVGLVESDSAV